MSQNPCWERFTDAREARQALKEMRAGALWLHCAATATVEASSGVLKLPFVHVAPEGRADVADIPGAVRREGLSGSADVAWRFIVLPREAEGVMDIEVKAPVRCRFHVAVSARVHRSILEQVADAGVIGLATTCPQDVADVPPIVWIRMGRFAVLRTALEVAS